MGQFILALDQGTTSSRAILFTEDGRLHSIAQKEISQIYPQVGWVEQSPSEIWASQLSVTIEAMAKVGVTAKEIAAIGITNQRETTIVWDKNTGLPIYNAISWQCRRTADYCRFLIDEGFNNIIKSKTGLTLDAYFSATKLKWILDNVPNAREQALAGNLLFGTVDTWLLWQLTEGEVFSTDYSNASRTMLYNIHKLQWDEEILNKFNIPSSMLPTVKPSSYIFGKSKVSLIGKEIPIAGIAGDQQAALFGHCCFKAGMVKNTYGTGCFTLMNTGEDAIVSKNGLITTIAWGEGGNIQYALEGSVFIAGAAVQWLRDGLKIIDTAELSEYYASKVSDTLGVYMVPAFVGIGAPYWDQYAKGVITGITQSVTKEHLIRATLESIAYQSLDIIKAMCIDTGNELTQIKVDGGASNNNFLMQFQSDILNAEVIRPKVTESTAIGVAFLAGLAVNLYKNKAEIARNIKPDQIFKPKMNEDTRKELIIGWHNAIERAFTK